MSMQLKYKARNESGKIIKGNILVENTIMFKQLINKLNLELISYHIVKKPLIFYEYHLNPLETSNFAKKMSLLLRSKMSIDVALLTIEKMTKNKILKKALLKMEISIKHGSSFSKALEEQNQLFPSFFCSMIKISEQSGDLVSTLTYLENYYFEEYQIKQKIKGSLVYPIILVLFAFLISLFMLFFIIPKFQKIFDEMEIETIPKITKLIFAFSSFFIKHYYIIAFIFCFLIILSIIFLKYLNPYLRDKGKLILPGIGKINRGLLYANFTKILWICLKRKILLLDSLNLLQDIIKNEYVQRKIQNMILEIEKGSSLTKAITKINIFPSLFLELISVGESGNNIDDCMQTLANYYENELKIQLSKITQLIEPFIIIFIALVVGLIIIAIFLPMFGVMDKVMEV